MIRTARTADRAALLELLQSSALPLAGVEGHFPGSFLIAEEQGRVVGAAGVEVYGSVGLLRSVVVAPDQRGTGLGQRLSQAAVAFAAERGVRELYLLTTTADRFFPRLGFQAVERAALPEALAASEELRGACPASAVAMRLEIPRAQTPSLPG